MCYMDKIFHVFKLLNHLYSMVGSCFCTNSRSTANLQQLKNQFLISNKTEETHGCWMLLLLFKHHNQNPNPNPNPKRSAATRKEGRTVIFAQTHNRNKQGKNNLTYIYIISAKTQKKIKTLNSKGQHIIRINQQYFNLHSSIPAHQLHNK